MLKSRGRTDEVSAMEMEEWPQVNYNSFNIIQLNTRISSMSKRVTTRRKGWCLVPKTKQEPSVDSLRHTEYYGMQQTYDDLYAKSKNGELFPKLMDIVLSRENILLAYRNIKANSGSNTPGTGELWTEKEDTAQSQSGAKIYQSPMARPGPLVSRVFGTGWYSNVSSKSWSRYVKLSLAITAMVFDRAVQWNTQSAEPISWCNWAICIM